MIPNAEPGLEGLRSYIEAEMPSWSCPGVAVAVVRGSEVIHQTVLGHRDLEANLPLTVNTRFPLASVTKSFAAMSLALLVDEGKLSWDTPLREYMPEFVLKDEYATQHVAARDILSHRTGLPRHDLSAWRLDLPPGEFVKRLRHLEFSASFREKFQYNNLMYYSVAHLVATLTGVKWETFVRERIFQPLGMASSNFRPEPPEPGQPLAKGYRVERDDQGVAERYVEAPLGSHTELSPGAAGALFSTLADLTRWLEVHVNEGIAGGNRLVSTGNLKEMQSPHTIIPSSGVSEVLFGDSILTYGLGWMIEPYRGRTLVHHGGNVEGHSLIVGFVPSEKLGVVVLCNVAATFLRDALLYEALDRALGNEPNDWSGKFHSLADPLLAGQARSKTTSAAERVAGAPPSRPLEEFVGEFTSAGYPDLSIRLANDKLEACTVGSLPYTPLTHYHYDVFEWDLVDWDLRMKLRFLTSDTGEIDSVSVPIEPAVPNIVFTRKAPELEPETVAALVGLYQPPVAGMSIAISSAQGKLFMTVEGSPAKELMVHKVSSEMVGLRFDRARLEFEREGGRFARLVYKADGLTLVAERV